MEAKVHEELLSFLAKHSLEETVSNIDDIVLSYLVGVVELVSQGDDGLDVVELIEMMNAYLPGFDQIGRSEVIDWMFGLASKLIGCIEVSQESPWNGDKLSLVTNKSEVLLEVSSKTDLSLKDTKFPTYDYVDRKLVWDSSLKNGSVSVLESLVRHSGTQAKYETGCNGDCQSLESISSPRAKNIPPAVLPVLTLPETDHQQSCSKRKGRQLSCSSQDSQDEIPKQTDTVTIKEAQVRVLLDMFPSACTMEARHCLQLSAGNMDRAAQLIMDRQDTGQAIKSQAKAKSLKKNHKVKKTVDYKLDDASIKSCVVEKYSFIDTEEDKKTYRPPPPKGEAKKLVRYRDGQVVSMKGERFTEVKGKEEENMKASYINLKPARKYRFH
ncbi:unnamed protein product [Candidula unifasciata]|uniref:CUE domain-containing protein 2 n=1 Tax=Candidula unifasciata TaxID=100452 RepID=A0A8S3YWA2_9EUPU|nr:unnamed protein product [Candidula unifasciata]